jgi:hypothetical protein
MAFIASSGTCSIASASEDWWDIDHTRLTVQVTVQSVQPQRQFSYRWQHPRGAAAGDGNSLLVEFTLTAEGEGTRLRVVETGLEQMGWSDEQQDTYVREHNFGRVTYLGRLRDYLGRQHAGQMP